MPLGPSFLRASARKDPLARRMASGLLGTLLNTVFVLQRGECVTSDTLRITHNTRPTTKSDKWYEDFGYAIQLVAKKNDRGNWDIQKVTHWEQQMEFHTFREMIRLDASLETMQSLFAEQNCFRGVTGREFRLQDKGDKASEAKPLLRMDYLLECEGSYRGHRLWPLKAEPRHPAPPTPPCS